MTDLIPRLVEQLIQHEGLRKKVYYDTLGVPTIGVGRNLRDVGISDEEARYLLDNDISKVFAQAVTLPYWPDLSDNRRLVILDMAFNLGWDGLMAFKNTLQAVADKRYTEAAKLMLKSRWALQVGKRAKDLSRMMETG